MKLGHLKQVILYVSDMEGMVKFYRDKLGLTINYPLVDDYTDEDWVAFSTGECTLALHSGGKGRIGEDAPRFTFDVSDAKVARKSLLDKGVKMGELREAYPGSFVCAGKDIEGNVFYVQSHPSQS